MALIDLDILIFGDPFRIFRDDSMCRKLVLREAALVRESLVAAWEVTDVRELTSVQVDMLQHVALLSKLLPTLVALVTFDFEVNRIGVSFQAIFEEIHFVASWLWALIHFLTITHLVLLYLCCLVFQLSLSILMTLSIV